MTVAGAAARAESPARADRAMVWFGAALVVAIASQAVLALLLGPLPAARRADWPVALGLMLALALPTALVLVATFQLGTRAGGGLALLAVAAAGLAMRLPYLGAGPLLEDDHFRFLLDGALVTHGFSPYRWSPEAVLSGVSGLPEALIGPGREAIAHINFPDLRSIYPGAAQALFAFAHLLDPWGMDGLRLVILASEALSAWLLWRLLPGLGRPPLWVALVWCNPLFAFTLTGQAHVDGALIPPLLVALIAAHRGAGLVAGVGLAVAVGVKLWPVLLAPLLARALWPRRGALIGFGLGLSAGVALLCGPLLIASLQPSAGLVAYAGGWSVNSAPQAWASYAAFALFGVEGERAFRLALALAGGLLALALAWRPIPDLKALLARAAWLAAAVFYLSPAQFPWYAVWFAPLAVLAGPVWLMGATVGLPVYMLFFPLAEAGLRDWHGYGLAALHLVPVLAFALWMRRGAAEGPERAP